MRKYWQAQLCVLFFIALFLNPLTAEAEKKIKPKMVKIETTMGDIKIMLYNETPLHRDNFLKLVSQKFYNNILFHRVIKDFMIQAGDPDSKTASADKQLGTGDVGYTIPAEIVFPKYCHKRGALAAARQSDIVNPERASSGCQFYIVDGEILSDQELNDTELRLNQMLKPVEPIKYTDEQRLTYKMFGGSPHLDGQYTVFGEVVKGFDVLRKIATVKTDAHDRPIEDVRILSMKVVRK
ncbi:MAG: peptidylprolyl isomerase [Sphingobacteriia bacterium]|jgi:cyclophilin family peptidyl-prolyl cis-trans isomerase|nr:peptidylprolyl isomerase [Paludibacteraceae bacterium]NCA80193.1 peptidylprolyl isomerase [Sphingobacteriia bacterium]